MEPMQPWKKFRAGFEIGKANLSPLYTPTLHENELIEVIVRKIVAFLETTGILDLIRNNGELIVRCCNHYTGFESQFQPKTTLSIDELKLIHPELKKSLKSRIFKEIDPGSIKIRISQGFTSLEMAISNCKKAYYIDGHGLIIDETPVRNFHTHPIPNNHLQGQFHLAELKYANPLNSDRINEVISYIATYADEGTFMDRIKKRKIDCKIKLSIDFNFSRSRYFKASLTQYRTFNNISLREIVTILEIVREKNILPMLPDCRFNNSTGSRVPYFVGTGTELPSMTARYVLYNPTERKKL